MTPFCLYLLHLYTKRTCHHTHFHRSVIVSVHTFLLINKYTFRNIVIFIFQYNAKKNQHFFHNIWENLLCCGIFIFAVQFKTIFCDKRNKFATFNNLINLEVQEKKQALCKIAVDEHPLMRAMIIMNWDNLIKRVSNLFNDIKYYFFLLFWQNITSNYDWTLSLVLCVCLFEDSYFCIFTINRF